MKTSRFIAGIGLTFALGAMALTTRNPAPTTAAHDEAEVAQVTAGLLEQAHFSQQRFDRTVSAQFFDHYLDVLDGSRMMFLQSDLDEFERFRTTLGELTLQAGDTRPAFEIFDRFRQRVDERAAYVRELLNREAFDFTGDESYTPDREKARRPRDPAEARMLWRQYLRFEYLQEKLNQKQPDEIVKTLTKRYEHLRHTMAQLTHESVLEIYLTALTHVYDPHSDYLGPRQAEDFSIAMNLSLCGIGATLQAEDGYCKIRELVPGGPAARSKLIKPGDRIVTVAQDGKEPVELIDMPLDQAVGLIRGPKGTKVNLTVIPVNSTDSSARKTLTLVRDEVKLEDQEAKARILDLPGDKAEAMRVGVIDLPSFYSDTAGHRPGQTKSAAADVAKLIEKLKREHVRGIVLDLRHNGGGSLEEAIKLTGLFISRGPVVQTRDTEGAVDVEGDTDPSVAYDGPLVVLTSRFSASASEIVAGALQDYGRAVLVGDSSTYGKGTVQNVLPLADVMRRAGFSPRTDPGALKLTIRKFYRPGGASTQLKGVVPDIVLPSLNNEAKFGEAEMYHALPWDQVPPARFRPLGLVQPHLTALRAKSEARLSHDEEFAWLREDAAKFHERMANPAVSLNETKRLQEKTDANAQAAARKKQREAHRGPTPMAFDIRLKNVDQPGLPAPVAVNPSAPQSDVAVTEANPGDEESSPDAKTGVGDITLDEATRILADYVTLLSGGRAPELAGHAAARN